MSQALNWVKEKTMRLGVAIVTGDSGSDACRCADELWHFLCTCTVVSHGKNRADDHDIIE